MLNKLTINKEFRRVYGRGKSFVDAAFVSYIMPNKSNIVRIGITVSKKLGGAVQRNRAKRLITAAFYECQPYINGGCDIVFVARTRIFKRKSYEIAHIMQEHFISAGVWKENDE